MENNYLHLIKKSRLVKRSDTQVNIPTFNGYEITKKTIKALLKQQGVCLDILLIDNASQDYIKLSKDFPSINYVVLETNTGSSGAQRIGAELAIKNGYKYVVFTDNDALMLNKRGVTRMRTYMENFNAGAIHPLNIEGKQPVTTRGCTKSTATTAFHYLMIKTSTLIETGLHSFDLFLYGDDVALTAKIISNSTLLKTSDVLFYHPPYTPKMFSNKYNYTAIRNLTYIMLYERGISLSIKLKIGVMCLLNIMKLACYFIQTRDVSYLKTLFKGFEAGLCRRKYNADSIKDAKCQYVLEEETKLDSTPLSNLSMIILRKSFYYYSRYKKRNIYFVKKCPVTQKKYGVEYYKQYEAGFVTTQRPDHRRIIEFCQFTSDDNVLEIGCGYGTLLEKINCKIKKGIESNNYAVNVCKKKGLVADLLEVEDNLNEQNSTYDYVIMNEVLEHIQNPKKVVEECHRILKKGGKLVITSPAKNFFIKNTDPTHVSEMTVEELSKLVKQSGFAILTHEVSGISFITYVLEKLFFKPTRVAVETVSKHKQKAIEETTSTKSFILWAKYLYDILPTTRLMYTFRTWGLRWSVQQLVVAKKV